MGPDENAAKIGNCVTPHTSRQDMKLSVIHYLSRLTDEGTEEGRQLIKLYYHGPAPRVTQRSSSIESKHMTKSSNEI
uniref:TEA domain-containing protein n=1 Tax=Heterorhabditis bacteriophora TaxID=37862 RepID=A0A1I7XLJ8_HETBA